MARFRMKASIPEELDLSGAVVPMFPLDQYRVLKVIFERWLPSRSSPATTRRNASERSNSVWSLWAHLCLLWDYAPPPLALKTLVDALQRSGFKVTEAQDRKSPYSSQTYEFFNCSAGELRTLCRACLNVHNLRAGALTSRDCFVPWHSAK